MIAFACSPIILSGPAIKRSASNATNNKPDFVRNSERDTREGKKNHDAKNPTTSSLFGHSLFSLQTQW
jgi:hypothetical protein